MSNPQSRLLFNITSTSRNPRSLKKHSDLNANLFLSRSSFFQCTAFRCLPTLGNILCQVIFCIRQVQNCFGFLFQYDFVVVLILNFNAIKKIKLIQSIKRVSCICWNVKLEMHIWNLKCRFVSLNLCVWFFMFDSDSFLWKFKFFFNKMHGVIDFKTS